jgi:hypothetical protein
MSRRASFLVGLGALAISLSGCAMQQIGPPIANINDIQAIRVGAIGPLQVGTFTPAPGRPTEMDKSVSVRAGYQNAPGGSYAAYLGDVLATDLKAAGRFDPASTLVVSGVVTRTHLDSEIGAGHGELEAHFTLTKKGAVTFDKTLSVENTWDSSYFADLAIPAALNNYAGLFQSLANKLFTDPDFIAATKR